MDRVWRLDSCICSVFWHVLVELLQEQPWKIKGRSQHITLNIFYDTLSSVLSEWSPIQEKPHSIQVRLDLYDCIVDREEEREVEISQEDTWWKRLSESTVMQKKQFVKM